MASETAKQSPADQHAEREQRLGGRHGDLAANPSDQEGPKPLADRHRDHVVPECDLARARARAAHRQHLLGGHQEHVAGAEQDREEHEMDRGARPGPERDAGRERHGAPDPGRMRVMATVDVAADP